LVLRIDQVQASDNPCYPLFLGKHLSRFSLADSKGNHIRHFLHILTILGDILGPLHSVALQQFALLIIVSLKHGEQCIQNRLEKMLRIYAMLASPKDLPLLAPLA
jgi:hypothetical protein